MASIPTTSKQSIVLASTSGTGEENKIDYENYLSAEDTDIEINTDTSTWSTADKKKTTTHDGVPPRISVCLWRGSLNQNYNEKNISYESPMPKAVCEEEMQSVQLDHNEVIIEYITHICQI